VCVCVCVYTEAAIANGPRADMYINSMYE